MQNQSDKATLLNGWLVSGQEKLKGSPVSQRQVLYLFVNTWSVD